MVRAVAVFRQVALGILQLLQKLRFQVSSIHLLAQPDSAARVLNHLHRFDSRSSSKNHPQLVYIS